jgi:hypothetical protein
MDDPKLLKKFIGEQFPIKELFKVGFFTKEMKGDYSAMAKRICNWFGYETVYEYGAKEIRCHISPTNIEHHVDVNGVLQSEPFITVIPSIYD